MPWVHGAKPPCCGVGVSACCCCLCILEKAWGGWVGGVMMPWALLWASLGGPFRCLVPRVSTHAPPVAHKTLPAVRWLHTQAFHQSVVVSYAREKSRKSPPERARSGKAQGSCRTPLRRGGERQAHQIINPTRTRLPKFLGPPRQASASFSSHQCTSYVSLLHACSRASVSMALTSSLPLPSSLEA